MTTSKAKSRFNGQSNAIYDQLANKNSRNVNALSTSPHHQQMAGTYDAALAMSAINTAA